MILPHDGCTILTLCPYHRIARNGVQGHHALHAACDAQAHAGAGMALSYRALSYRIHLTGIIPLNDRYSVEYNVKYIDLL